MSTRVATNFLQLFQVWRSYFECLLGVAFAIPKSCKSKSLKGFIVWVNIGPNLAEKLPNSSNPFTSFLNQSDNIMEKKLLSINELRSLLGSKLIRFEQQQIQFPLIIFATDLKPVLFKVMKGKWNTCDWKYIICVFKSYRQKLFELKESSKRCLNFSSFSAVFEKSAIILHQELSLNHSLEECLISKDLQIIRKKADSVYSSCTTEDFKAILLYVRDLDLAKCNTIQPKEKAKQQFHKPIVTSIFPRNLLCYLIFHLPNFFLSHLLNINNWKQPFNCARKIVVL